MFRRTVCKLSFAVSTKGSPYMKHLDLYARRDPQLVPYLLREVDIEFKRKCRKVNFCFWLGVCTVLLLYQQRVMTETIHYLKGYAEFVEAEKGAKDDDNAIRRRALVRIMNMVKSAYSRDANWTKQDSLLALECLENAKKL
eukprot:GILJ01029342.1.p1 GENE.GILJ01029342.1~~GILJ01029342.1.p1  ORF type:complete len:141 (+),score=10.75 GILJ01029342.1:38-460(+)